MEIDHEYTENIVCPYCGCEHGDSWEYNLDSTDTVIECYDCGEEFYAYREIEVTYSTKKAEKGKCSLCGKENMILKDYNGSFGKLSNLCKYCYNKELNRLAEIYIKKLEQKE